MKVGPAVRPEGIANMSARSGRGVAAGAGCAGGGLDVYPVDTGGRVVEHRGALGSRVSRIAPTADAIRS